MTKIIIKQEIKIAIIYTITGNWLHTLIIDTTDILPQLLLCTMLIYPRATCSFYRLLVLVQSSKTLVYVILTTR